MEGEGARPSATRRCRAGRSKQDGDDAGEAVADATEPAEAEDPASGQEPSAEASGDAEAPQADPAEDGGSAAAPAVTAAKRKR